MEGQEAALGGIRVAQTLQGALEALLAGYFDTLAFALGVNLVDHVVIDGEKRLELEARAHPLLERRQYPRERAVGRTLAPVQKRQPLGFPFDQGVEEIEHHRFDRAVIHERRYPRGSERDRACEQRPQVEQHHSAIEHDGEMMQPVEFGTARGVGIGLLGHGANRVDLRPHHGAGVGGQPERDQPAPAPRSPTTSAASASRRERSQG